MASQAKAVMVAVTTMAMAMVTAMMVVIKIKATMLMVVATERRMRMVVATEAKLLMLVPMVMGMGMMPTGAILAMEEAMMPMVAIPLPMDMAMAGTIRIQVRRHQGLRALAVGPFMKLFMVLLMLRNLYTGLL